MTKLQFFNFRFYFSNFRKTREIKILRIFKNWRWFKILEKKKWTVHLKFFILFFEFSKKSKLRGLIKNFVIFDFIFRIFEKYEKSKFWGYSKIDDNSKFSKKKINCTSKIFDFIFRIFEEIKTEDIQKLTMIQNFLKKK